MLKLIQSTKTDTHLIEIFKPSQKFWLFFKTHREQLIEKGYSVFHDKEYLVKRVSPLSVFAGFETKKIEDAYQPKSYYFLKNKQKKCFAEICASLMINKFALDGSDTGTGKTFIAISACKEFNLIPCVITVSTGVENWKKVAARHGLVPYFVWNYEGCIARTIGNKLYQPPNPAIIVQQHPYTGEHFYFFKMPQKACFIFDECHRAAGDSATGNLFLSAIESKYPVIASSATFCQDVTKFKALGVATGLFKAREYREWLKTVGACMDDENEPVMLNQEEILKKLNGYLFPRFGSKMSIKNDPTFPKVINEAQIFSISKSDSYNKAYEKHIKELHIKVAGASALEKKQRQIVLRLRFRQLSEMYKLELLKRLASEYVHKGYSVVFFLSFKESARSLATSLKTKYLITGDTDIEERQVLLKNFSQDKSRVFVLTCDVGGTSLNGLQDLQGKYPRIAFITPIEKAITLRQTLGRLPRADSKTPSRNVIVYAAGTIEEKVYASVVEKMKNITIIRDGDLTNFEY